MSSVQTLKDQPAGFKNYIEKVAVVGAGGYMGGYITRELLKNKKLSITAITREGSKSAIPAGVHKAPVDYSKPETLVQALKGQDFLVITLNVRAPPETSTQLIQAAADAGVKYIMPNVYGPNPLNDAMYADMGFDSTFKANMEKLADLGLKAVLAPCGFWYEFSLAGDTIRYGFDFPKRKLVLFDDGDVKVHTSTWPQAGRGAAATIGLPIYPQDAAEAADKSKPTMSRFWYPNAAFVSSFYVSQKDMFESVKRVTKTTDADWTITHEPAKQRWENAQKVLFSGQSGTGLDGSPLNPGQAFGMRMYTRIFFPGGDGLKEDQVDNDVLGLPKEDLDEWTKEAVRLVESGDINKYGQA